MRCHLKVGQWVILLAAATAALVTSDTGSRGSTRPEAEAEETGVASERTTKCAGKNKAVIVHQQISGKVKLRPAFRHVQLPSLLSDPRLPVSRLTRVNRLASNSTASIRGQPVTQQPLQTSNRSVNSQAGHRDRSWTRKRRFVGVDYSRLPESNSVDYSRLPESNSVDYFRLPDSNIVDYSRLPDSNSVDYSRLPDSNSVDYSELLDSNQAGYSELLDGNKFDYSELLDSNRIGRNNYTFNDNYIKDGDGGGYICPSPADAYMHNHRTYFQTNFMPFYDGGEEYVEIIIQNRSTCNGHTDIRVFNATALNVTVETCCITWCTHEFEIRVGADEDVLLNFKHFNVPGLYLGRSEAIGVCDEALNIVVDHVSKGSPHVNKSHVIGSFCGSNKPKSVYGESSRVKLVLRLKDNGLCEDNISFVVQIMPCLKFPYKSCHSSEYVSLGKTHGYISSPGLVNDRNYPNDLQCSWNISVPEGQLIRLQVEHIMLRDGDTIQIFPKIQDSRQFPRLYRLSNDYKRPIVLPGNECMVEFHSDSVKSGVGFNISYSAVRKSSFVPVYENQTLDCSDKAMITHEIICNYYVDCANGEDEAVCYYKKDPSCWPPGYRIGGRCYQAVLNQAHMSWTMAEEFCERNLSSHLLTINTVSKKRSIEKLIKYLGLSVSVMFLGLQRMRMQQVKQIYRRMWQWTDRTTAFFLPDEYRYEGWFTCSLLHNNYFHSIDCATIMDNISFICERKLEDASTPNYNNFLAELKARKITRVTRIGVFHCQSGEYISVEQQCDKVDNCFDRSDELNCDYQLMEDIMFSCDTQGLLAYTFVCDGIRGCLDSSDEKFCAPLDKSVLGPTLTTCTDGMTLDRQMLCDGKEDCRDASDEEDCTYCVGGSVLCPMIACLPQSWLTDEEIDCPIRDLKGRRAAETLFKDNMFRNSGMYGIVVPDGYGKFSIENRGLSCPATHVQCAEGYCIPVYMWCNDMLDCPGGEDENPDLCQEVCVGMYKCKYTQVCVHNDHLCDGYYQCPNHDDELLCSLQNLTCPQNCSCTRMEVTCSEYPRFSSLTPVRYLRLQQANVPDLHFDGIAMYSLIYLNVSSCGVKNVLATSLRYLNLKILDLSHNLVMTLATKSFQHCPNLKILILSHNQLDNVRFSFLEHTRELTKLDLSHNIKNELEDDCFHKAVDLEELTLAHMHIEAISPQAFNGLVRLKRLDLKGNSVATFAVNIFHSQKNLRLLVTDNFRLCCPSVKPSSLQFTDCHAPYDEISSCADILRTMLLRVALWLMAILTITGNLGVIIYRIFYDRGIKYSFRIIITCLSASDLIMGIYLVIIGSADVIYRDKYFVSERDWKSSTSCQVAGFLCLLSTETSVLFILLVTIDRLLAIAFPLHRAFHFNARSATVACAIIWAIGISMATVPLLPPFRHWELYSQKAVGVPLPITRFHFPGYDYAFAIVIVFNMFVFLLVAMGQLLIYLSVHLQKHPQVSEARLRQDTAIAKRLILVVISDCLCWFPITVMGLAARSGLPVPGEMYLVTTVFLLPANSAFNPFLYTANAILLARRNRRKKSADAGHELRQMSQ